jgi:hypothetical protein
VQNLNRGVAGAAARHELGSALKMRDFRRFRRLDALRLT